MNDADKVAYGKRVLGFIVEDVMELLDESPREFDGSKGLVHITIPTTALDAIVDMAKQAQKRM